MNSYDRFLDRVLLGVFLIPVLLCAGCGQDRQLKNVMSDLNCQSSERKVFAVQTLADMKDPSAVEAVITALNDSAPSVRRASARALGRMNGQAVEHALQDALDHWDTDVRREAAWALWQSTGNPRLLVELRRHLEVR